MIHIKKKKNLQKKRTSASQHIKVQQGPKRNSRVHAPNRTECGSFWKKDKVRERALERSQDPTALQRLGGGLAATEPRPAVITTSEILDFRSKQLSFHLRDTEMVSGTFSHLGYLWRQVRHRELRLFFWPPELKLWYLMTHDSGQYPSNTEDPWGSINCLAFPGLRGICVPSFKEPVVGNLESKMQIFPWAGWAQH